MKKDNKNIPAITRSSAAEYLTFIAASGGQETSVEMRNGNGLYFIKDDKRHTSS